MSRKKILDLLLLFMVCMVLFTMLARASDGLTKARVRVETVQNKTIVHQVRGSGKVEGTQIQAVFTEEGQRVSGLFAAEGQKVKKGDPLFQLDLDKLRETIRQAEKEAEELSLTGSDQESARALAEEQKEKNIRRAEEDYQLILEKGDISIKNAQDDYQTAINKLNALYANGSSGEEICAQQETVNARRQALNQAIIQRNDDVKAGERAIEDAREAQAEDSSQEKNTMELEEKQQVLERLRELEKNQGILTAPEDGLISSLKVSVGSQTSQEAAAVLTLYTGSFQVTGTVSEEEEKYITVGGEASLKKGSTTIEGAVVEQIQADEDSDLRKVVISVPEDAVEMGDMVEFIISMKQGPYTDCIPLTALHQANGEYFVDVLEETSSILGEELTIREVPVEVLDKNEQYAALSPGAVGKTEKIVSSSDKEIQGGSRVRLEEE